MEKIHRRLAGDKEARIGSFRITDNQFSGVDAALLDDAANAREDSFGGGAKSSTQGRVRSPEFWDACATLAVWAARLALPVRPVSVVQRLRVHRPQARRPPELPADQAQ